MYVRNSYRTYKLTYDAVLFIVEGFFDALRVFSEHNIVATFDAITAVLPKISGQLDTLLRHWNSLYSAAVSEQRQHTAPGGTLLDSTVECNIQQLGNEHIPSTAFSYTVRLSEG